MSAALLGLAWGARMGERSRKLILMKLVDCCRDDGKQIFPALRTVAEAAECSVRQVQKVIAEFCAVGLLRKVREGGCGPGSTACYEMDIGMLRHIASHGYGSVLAKAGYAENAELEGDAGDAPQPAKDEPGSPLAPPRMNGATDKGEQAVRPTPQEEPLNRERESAGAGSGGATADAGAGASEPCIADSAGLADFLTRWPTAAFDDHDLTAAAWAGLGLGERREALEHIAGYLDGLKRAGRTKIPAGQSYLGQRRWRLLPEDVRAKAAGGKAAGAGVAVEPMSRDWWAVLFDRVARRAPCGLMVQFAAEKKTYRVPDGEMPGEAARGALKPFVATGAEMRAWAEWLRRRGVNLPRFRDDFWVYLPDAMPASEEAA